MKVVQELLVKESSKGTAVSKVVQCESYFTNDAIPSGVSSFYTVHQAFEFITFIQPVILITVTVINNSLNSSFFNLINVKGHSYFGLKIDSDERRLVGEPLSYNFICLFKAIFSLFLIYLFIYLLCMPLNVPFLCTDFGYHLLWCVKMWSENFQKTLL